MMDPTGLVELGALGTMLAAVASVAGYLIRDLVRQRDRAMDAGEKMADSVDRLAGSVSELTASAQLANDQIRTIDTTLRELQGGRR